MRVGLVCCAVLWVSCAERAAVEPGGGGADPWAAHSGSAGKRGGSDREIDHGVDGLDLRGMLSKIAEGVTRPGPYEAPEQTPGFDAARPHWGVLALGGDIVERSALSWSGGHGSELRAVIERLRELARDDKLTGVVVRAGSLGISLPDAVELRAAIHDLRAAGKIVACHGEGASNAGYLVLAACQRVGLAPLGTVVISGPTAMPVHVRPLLDKLGIQADFVHIGAYKGAAEPLTRDAPSREAQETLAAILDQRYQTMVDVIASERKLVPAKVQALIDAAMFPAEQARAAQLIDDVSPFEEFRDAAVGKAPWGKLELIVRHDDPLGLMLAVWRFLGAIAPDRPAGDHVALVYALGNIVDGNGDGVLGAREQIAAHTLVAALRRIAADGHVKAVVLRIDSGGGSAQASELIWRAVAELVKRKPVIVSMSDVAASGGYYIASGATKIFALPDTLTGSIGVVGGKLAVQDALGRLGVRTYPVGRGKRATMMAGVAPWSDDERGAVRTEMEAIYQVFVGRVAEGRHRARAEIDAIAQGRVWTGTRAKQLGLIDELGGLDAAIAEARKLASVDPATELEIYPPAPSLRDIVVGIGRVQAPFGLNSGATGALRDALALASPAIAAATDHLIQLVLSFRSSTIQAVAMLPVIQ